MYDWDHSAPVARGGGAEAKRMHEAVRGIWGVAFVVASPAGLCYNPAAPVRARFQAGEHNNENTNQTQTDGAGALPSGERRADRKGDLFAVRDA